jgi:mRNA-degrading endonuclease RelE of RelBE toxin-antitoxin system
VPADPAAWKVDLSKAASRVLTRHRHDEDFCPTIEEVIAELKRDPKQFPKKHGRLEGIRAAPLRYRNAPWRIPYLIDEEQRIVTVITIDKHDAAYRAAGR